MKSACLPPMAVAGARKFGLVVALTALLCGATLTHAAPASGGAPLVLAERGATEYVIVTEPEVRESLAARELQLFLQRLTGATYRFGTASAPRRILLGRSAALSAVLSAKTLNALGDQEALVMTKGTDLILVGGGKLGTLYAVYSFLEQEGGCRWWTARGDMTVPARDRFIVRPVVRRTKPVLTYRNKPTLFYTASREPYVFCGRNRVNMSVDAGWVQLALDSPQCHTLFYYVPADASDNPWGWKWTTPQRSYFETNPEFFSQDASGNRRKDMQLCFSNPGLRAEFTRRLKERVALHPEREVFHIGAMDWPGKWCYCEGCKALETRYQCVGGPYFDYVIEAANAIKHDYPHAKVSFMAYRTGQSEDPPLVQGPLPDNLVLIFAPIEDDMSKPLDHPNNAATYARLKRWAQIVKHVWVWHYSLIPMGSLERTAKDTALIAAAGCDGTYYQHGYGLEQYNFEDLYTWVTIRLFQNPRQDYHKLVAEFCDYYYGAASPAIQRYLADLETYCRNFNGRLSWTSDPIVLGYTPDDLRRWSGMFDEMERATANSPDHLAHVQESRVLLDLLVLRRWPTFSQRFPDSGLSPETLAERIVRHGKATNARRMDANYAKSPDDGLAQMVADALLRATTVPKPLPAPLADLPETRVRQVFPTRADAKMDDAALGVAIRPNAKPLEVPFTFGVYDGHEKGSHLLNGGSIKREEIVPDRFHLYKLGTTHLTANCYVWLTGSWSATIPLKEAYDDAHSRQAWDVYASLKFEGPGYSAQSTATVDNVWCDRVVLVAPAADGP